MSHFVGMSSFSMNVFQKSLFPLFLGKPDNQQSFYTFHTLEGNKPVLKAYYTFPRKVFPKQLKSDGEYHELTCEKECI